MRLHLLGLLALLVVLAQIVPAAVVLTPSEKFIQPGRHMGAAPPPGSGLEAGAQCSIAFILRDGPTGRFYATTAGHCLAQGADARSNMWWSATPTQSIVWGEAIRSVVVRVDPCVPAYGCEVTTDYALIWIDDEFQDNVDPAVAIFGGPTGVADLTSVPLHTPAAHHGLPAVFGTPAGLARAGIYMGYAGDEWRCACATVKGDSGSPVIELGTGKALGIHSGRHVHPSSADPGMGYGLSLASVLEDLHTFPAWQGLQVATAPLSEFGAQWSSP